jgi:hypothetical protein
LRLKVLLDECIDRRLAREIGGHAVTTVSGMGWAGVKNGALLRKAEGAGFDAFITADRNLAFQQPVARFHLAVLVLRASKNRYQDFLPLVPKIETALKNPLPGRVVFISSRE